MPPRGRQLFSGQQSFPRVSAARLRASAHVACALQMYRHPASERLHSFIRSVHQALALCRPLKPDVTSAAGTQRTEDGWHPVGPWMNSSSMAPIHCKQGLDKRHLPDRCGMSTNRYHHQLIAMYVASEQTHLPMGTCACVWLGHMPSALQCAVPLGTICTA